MSKRMRKIAILTASLVAASSFVVTQAAVLEKTVTAAYYNIKVAIDGQYKTPTNEPFMINNSVYVGLRDFSELTGSEVAWDGATKTVKVTSNKADTTVLESEIIEKNLKIAQLEAQLKTAQAKIEQYEQSSSTESEDGFDVSSSKLKDAVSYLNSKYDDQYDIEWDFDLSFNADKQVLEFEVAYDSSYDKDYYKELTKYDMSRFLDKMCDTIQDRIGEIKIVGELIDIEEDEVLYEFEMSTSGRIKVNKLNTAASLDDFEDMLKDDDDYEHLVALPLGVDGAIVSNIDITDFDLDEDYDFEDMILEIDTRLTSSYADAWKALDDGSDASDEALSDLENWLEEFEEMLLDEFSADRAFIYLRNSSNKVVASLEDGNFRHFDF